MKNWKRGSATAARPAGVWQAVATPHSPGHSTCVWKRRLSRPGGAAPSVWGIKNVAFQGKPRPSGAEVGSPSCFLLLPCFSSAPICSPLVSACSHPSCYLGQEKPVNSPRLRNDMGERQCPRIRTEPLPPGLPIPISLLSIFHTSSASSCFGRKRGSS